MKCELTFFGVRGSYPCTLAAPTEFGRNTSCIALMQGDCGAIVDCGSGLPGAAAALADCAHIDILLTHLHYDHILGLLQCSELLADPRVRVFGPAYEPSLAAKLADTAKPPYWPSGFGIACGAVTGLSGSGTAELACGAVLGYTESAHPNGGLLYRIDANGKRIAFVFDYEHGSRDISEFVAGSELMIYDGTFTDAEYESHRGWGHSTWRAGTVLAESAGVRRIVFTHHCCDRSDAKLCAMEAEAISAFANSGFAREGARYDI